MPSFVLSPARLLSAVLFYLLLPHGSPIAAQESTHSTHVGGYGEVHYRNPSGPNTPAEVNFRRFVVYLAHTFNEHVSFHSEVELEDARIEGGDEPGGEVALEQAYLDYEFSSGLKLRSGLILPPVGIINEIHEPPTFNGVDRPGFDHDVIPTTWREIGIGVVGRLTSIEGLSYRVYLMNGLIAEGFSAEEGIRGGRQEGQEASFANPSLTGRLEWARPGLKVAGSFWYGGTANQDPTLGTGTFDAPVLVLVLDARYDIGPWAFRGVVGNVNVSDAEAINAVYGNDVGSRIAGAYVEGAVNLLQLLKPSASEKLLAFARYEQFDTHAGVPTGTIDNPELARRITTLGLTFKPTHNAVFKGDYQLLRNAAATDEGEILSFGVGYSF